MPFREALKPAALRFGFQLAGQPFDPGDTTWSRTERIENRSDGVTATCTQYRHGPSGLVVEEERLAFADSPAMEWVLHFRNEGAGESPVISAIQPLDVTFRQADACVPIDQTAKARKTDFILHFMRGGISGAEDYRPYLEYLGTIGRPAFSLSAKGGRSSNQHLPFFNLQCGETTGVICAIGWSGQWRAGFDITAPHTLRLRAGMETAELSLHPGECIRTPRMVLLPWEGDCIDGNNLWRRFLARHHTLPLRGDRPLPQTWADTFFTFNSGYDVTTANQKDSMSAAARMGIETLVVDAGWYECTKQWWDGVGNWTPRDATFPDGIRPMTEHGQTQGIGFGLWFEPERVYRDTQLWREHPEWCLGLPEGQDQAQRLLNLGLPEVQEWLLALIEGYIAQGLTWFRHDFNIDPLAFWQAADAPDRKGMTEIRYMEGLYRVYDELHRRHPDLLIEGCASGGRRLDLETISRNHGYWATDMMCGTPEPMQAHIWGFNHYLPANLHNTVLREQNAPVEDTPANRYRFFSFLGGAPCCCFDVRDPAWNETLGRKWIDLFKSIRHLTLGDYYPLTEYSLSRETWTGYQFHRPDLGEGLVAVFRRPESPYPAARFRLRGMAPHDRYEWRELFTGATETRSGQALMDGVNIALAHQPDMALYRYACVKTTRSDA